MNGKSPKLGLKLNRSPPRRRSVGPSREREGHNSPNKSSPMSPRSPQSSCLSSESDQGMKHYSSSPEIVSMVLAGCSRCLIYVMVSEEDPKCPKCKSLVLLDFLNDNTENKKNNKI
ncbi:hypothetical protein DsansV1_C09g0092611 [Dioscorea sansibarensis]